MLYTHNHNASQRCYLDRSQITNERYQTRTLEPTALLLPCYRSSCALLIWSNAEWNSIDCKFSDQYKCRLSSTLCFAFFDRLLFWLNDLLLVYGKIKRNGTTHASIVVFLCFFFQSNHRALITLQLKHKHWKIIMG